MTNSCNTTTSPFLSGCNPTITILCILSCAFCTIVMIWGVYAMRVDMIHMEQMLQTSPKIMSQMNRTQGENNTDPMMEHCKMMPEMMGCEKYKTPTEKMNHDMMNMSMNDMGNMLEGKTGDELNRAFLEGMIPHHQGAVEMAKYLSQSNKPELVKLGTDIIAAQTKEINQMKQWMKDWGYETGSIHNESMSSKMMIHNP